MKPNTQINRLALYSGMLLLAVLSAANAKDFFVAPDGKDTEPGSMEAPFATIQHAFDQASPGDTVYLRGGTYRQAVTLTGKSGKEGAPLTLKSYQDEKSVLSGLDELKLNWESAPGKRIYVATLDTNEVRQLFYNGKPLLEARWPNTPRDTNGDWNFFTPAVWASAETTGNSYGTLVCQDLAKTGWDVTGAHAVLNVDHQFFTWTRQVRTHAAGSNAITYDKDLGKDVDRTDEGGVSGKWNERNKFYLFGKKEFLDAPGEWFLDVPAKKLYLCLAEGESPEKGLMEIKNRDWGFKADQNSSYLTVDGIGFFATAFQFGKAYSKQRSSHIVFRNNRVLHSSWTEHLRLPKEDALSFAENVYPTMDVDRSEILNNTFAYGALSALYVNGFDNLIENNLFTDFDYNSSLSYPPLQVSKAWPALVGKAGRATVRHNTFSRSGGIQAQIAHADNDFSMNDVVDSFLACFGGNKDTSAVYTQKPFCSGTRFHHNWVHHGFSGNPPLKWGGGIGIRGDDDTCGLTVDHNVVWGFGGVGIEIKNVPNPTPEQANRCVNNTIFDHGSFISKKGAILMASVKAAMNSESTVANNLGDPICGWWGGKPLGKMKLLTNNVTSFNPAQDLVSTNWHDFRPVANATSILMCGTPVQGISSMVGTNAPDIGAYQRGDVTYWIPGQRLAKASFPIVPDKAQSVPTDRDTLMWRPAYQAVRHTLYFAPSEEDLAKAEPKTFEGEENVFKLTKLSSGQSYFWRVDAVMPDKTVIKGDVWTFTTKNN